MNQSELLALTPQQRREQLMLFAVQENAALMKLSDGRSVNFGINNRVEGGRPRITDMMRSKPAQELLFHAINGDSLTETASILGLTVAQAKRKARRYQISFTDWKYQE